MDLNDRERAYVDAVDRALRNEANELLTTVTCPECEHTLGVDLDPSTHIVLFDTARDSQVVVIGCDMYHVVNPNDVGIPDPYWTGIQGVNC